MTYYELLNKYVVTLRTERLEPFLLLALGTIPFDVTLIQRYRGKLRLGIEDNDLVARIDKVLASAHGSFEPVPPILDDDPATGVAGACAVGGLASEPKAHLSIKYKRYKCELAKLSTCSWGEVEAVAAVHPARVVHPASDVCVPVRGLRARAPRLAPACVSLAFDPFQSPTYIHLPAAR